MLRNMATSLFEKKAIVTTVHKAKALRPLTDKLVGLAKKGDLAALRKAKTYFTKRKVLRTLFADVRDNELFSERNCGYSTMSRIGLRKGDAAVLVRVALIGPDYQKVGSTSTKGSAVTDRAARVAASKAKQKTNEETAQAG
jgi:large subunit ribosomal protein L17